ncbi:hypothetical protein [Streptomyces phaeochromogenes]
MAAQKEHNAAWSTHSTAKSQQLTARAASNNPFAAGRRAARVASKAAARHERDTRAKLKAARVNYPSTLKARAIQAHSVHAVPGAIASALMSTSQLTVWPAATSAVLVRANVVGLALGRRRLRVVVDESLSLEAGLRGEVAGEPEWRPEHPGVDAVSAQAACLPAHRDASARFVPAEALLRVRSPGRWREHQGRQ